MAEHSVSNGIPGSTTVGYRIRGGGVTGARVTAGIVETPAASGVFIADISATPPFTIIWDDNTVIFASEDVLSPASTVAGSTSYIVTVNGGTNPLDGVSVWVTTDAAGTHTIASGVTDDQGQATFLLDPGTYYLWKQLAGWTFLNPESITVT